MSDQNDVGSNEFNPSEFHPKPFEYHSLADFEQHPAKYLRRFRKTGRPMVLTADGKAQVIVQSAHAYQDLLDRIDRAEATLAVRKALDALDRGEKGLPLDEAFEQIRAAARERHGADSPDPSAAPQTDVAPPQSQATEEGE